MHGQEYVMKMKAAGSLGPVVVNSSGGKESACNVGEPPVLFLGEDDLLEKR